MFTAAKFAAATTSLPSTVPVLRLCSTTTLGAIKGAFLTTVMCSSFTFITSAIVIPWASFINMVCTRPERSVPCALRVIFILLGSVIPSVQNNISSTIFIPVIVLFSGKFKTPKFLFTLKTTLPVSWLQVTA